MVLGAKSGLKPYKTQNPTNYLTGFLWVKVLLGFPILSLFLFCNFRTLSRKLKSRHKNSLYFITRNIFDEIFFRAVYNNVLLTLYSGKVWWFFTLFLCFVSLKR